MAFSVCVQSCTCALVAPGVMAYRVVSTCDEKWVPTQLRHMDTWRKEEGQRNVESLCVLSLFLFKVMILQRTFSNFFSVPLCSVHFFGFSQHHMAQLTRTECCSRSVLVRHHSVLQSRGPMHGMSLGHYSGRVKSYNPKQGQDSSESAMSDCHGDSTHLACNRVRIHTNEHPHICMVVAVGVSP